MIGGRRTEDRGQRTEDKRTEDRGQRAEPLGRRFAKNVRVRHSLKIFITQMRGVVALFPQPFHHSHGHAHVCEKSHLRQRSARDDFFLSEPSSIF